MTPIDDKLIEHVTKTIVEKFNPRRIVLFGSHARGEAGPESDLDLMIEMETDRSFGDRIYDVYSLFSSRDWPMDVVVYTPEEVRGQRNIIGTFVDIIEAEGKTIYDARRDELA